MNKDNQIRIIFVTFLILFTLACSISINSSDTLEEDDFTQKDLELELTRVMLQLTQTAITAPTETEEEATEESEPGEMEEPAPVQQEQEPPQEPAPTTKKDSEKESENKEPAFTVTSVSLSIPAEYTLDPCVLADNYFVMGYVYVDAIGNGTVKLKISGDAHAIYTKSNSVVECIYSEAGRKCTGDSKAVWFEFPTKNEGQKIIKVTLLEPKYKEYVFEVNLICKESADIL